MAPRGNFPAGNHGRLVVRLRVGKSFGGVQIGLTDRMFEPCDDTAEKMTAFALAIDDNRRIADGPRLEPDKWHELELVWDERQCRIVLDGRAAGTLACRSPFGDGLSYLRLRSTATATDSEGLAGGVGERGSEQHVRRVKCDCLAVAGPGKYTAADEFYPTSGLATLGG